MRAPFDVFYRNSVIVSAGATLLVLIVGSMAGYAFARIRFRGRQLVFILLLGTIMMTNTTEMRTVLVGLAYFTMHGDVEWNLLMSAATMASVPLLIVFMVMQRQFIRGLTAGSVKG